MGRLMESEVVCRSDRAMATPDESQSTKRNFLGGQSNSMKTGGPLIELSVETQACAESSCTGFWYRQKALFVFGLLSRLHAEAYSRNAHEPPKTSKLAKMAHLAPFCELTGSVFVAMLVRCSEERNSVSFYPALNGVNDTNGSRKVFAN